jgi:hypothetical protein
MAGLGRRRAHRPVASIDRLFANYFSLREAPLLIDAQIPPAG